MVLLFAYLPAGLALFGYSPFCWAPSGMVIRPLSFEARALHIHMIHSGFAVFWIFILANR